MAQTIEVTLSWADVSTGAAGETGQEIDIYTDSPSFVPNVPINYTEARHPWMRLPPIAAGEVSAAVILRTPVTFVKFRVRQYNDQGPGEWAVPQLFHVTQASGTSTPPAPVELGMVVTDGAAPPPPPIDPPPPPPPVDTGGVTSNYAWTTQFSGVQGQNGWSYRDTAGLLVYSSGEQKWNGDELYLAIWNGGFRHGQNGSLKGAVLRYTVPESGEANITGNFQLSAPPGAVTVKIQHNGVDIFGPQNITDGTNYPYDEDVTVTAGDTIDFISNILGTPNLNNNVVLNPVILLTTDGVTPTLPTVASLAPTTFGVGVGGVQSITVTLSSAPTSAAVVSLSSSDAAKATVPATVTVPSGQLSATIVVTGVAIGASTITATYNGSNKTAVATVFAPASDTWLNVPAGWTVLNDHNHSSLNTNGWRDVYNISAIVSDASAPVSPPLVMRQTFSLGLVGGNGGGGGNIYAFPSAVSAVYWGFAMKTDNNFENHPSGTKIGWIHTRLNNVPQNNQFFLVMNATAAFYLTAVYQNGNIDNGHITGGPLGTAVFYPTVSSGVFAAGQQVIIETVLRPSTTNVSRDGTWKVWVNNALAISVLNLNTDRVQPDAVSHITIWGGVGGTKQRDSYLYFDHSRICVP